MPEPASGQTNRFYTREFFALCAARLKRGGVLAFRLRAAENLWTPQLLRRTASIYQALQAEFKDVVVLPGATNIILAADSKLPRDPVFLGERLIVREVEARLVSPAYVNYLYTNDRFAEIDSLLSTTPAPENSDIKPVCYQFTLLIWLAKFFPVLSWLDWPQWGGGYLVRSPWSWLILVLIVGGWFLCRRWTNVRNTALVAMAGFVGMVLETVLILQYQTASGVLYQNLGLLLMLFMAGLAGGAAFMDWVAHEARLIMRLPQQATGESVEDKGTSRSEFPGKVGVILVALFVIWCLLAAWLSGTGAAGNLLVTALLLFGCGFLVAAVFAFGSLQNRPDQRMIISPLYAADLLGGCLGSLVASFFLIPALGLVVSSLLMSFLVLTTFLLL
jgi:spermidine synthase